MQDWVLVSIKVNMEGLVIGIRDEISYPPEHHFIIDMEVKNTNNLVL
jgi:hypothetical protein